MAMTSEAGPVFDAEARCVADQGKDTPWPSLATHIWALLPKAAQAVLWRHSTPCVRPGQGHA